MVTRKHTAQDKVAAQKAEALKAKNANVANLEIDRAAHVLELGRLHEILREIPGTTTDEGDPTVFEREKTVMLIHQVEDHIAEIDHALEAAHHGGYGICERCGQPIDAERLKILPETRVCVKCKSLQEGRAHHRAWKSGG